MKINENLNPNDLVGLVKQFISIDEYESKIDPKACVVAFFVKEEDPAYDLSRFLEFGPVKGILDTEVSPAPDEHGDYLVFVEIEYSTKRELAAIIKNVLKVVKHLTGYDTWDYSYQNKPGKTKV